MEDNEVIFGEDANLDARQRIKPRSQRGDHRHIGDSASSVGNDAPARSSSAAHEGEQSPLLGDDEDDSRSDDEAASRYPGSADFDGLPWYKQPSIYWLLPPFLLFTLAFGGIIVPKIDLILSLNCRQYFADRAAKDPSFEFMPIIFGGDNPQCNTPEVQAVVARFTLYCNFASGLLSAITSPKLGALSDRYGRRKIIALSSVGMLAGELLTIFCARNPDTISVNWILLGYMLEGVTGSFISAMALAHSYATDCTPPHRRGEVFGYFHGCLFIGIAGGPLIAGYIIKLTGQLLSMFYIALGVHLLFMCVILFIVPESLSRRRQLAAREKHHINKVDEAEINLNDQRRFPSRSAKFIRTMKGANLLAPLDILFPTGRGSSPKLRRNLLLLAAVDTTTFGVAMGSMTVVVIYSKFMFGWDTTQMATFVSIVNFGRVGMLMIALPIITRVFRGKQTTKLRNTGSDQLDLVLIRVSILFDMIGYLGYTLARTGPLFILSGVVASIGGIGSPTIQSSLTKHVPADRTGQLLGATGLLHALARVIAPTIFNLIYSVTVGKFTQTVFVCLTAAFGAAFVFACFIRPHVYLEDHDATSPVRPSTPLDEEVDVR
ncbi:MAG: hypothetical protein M4579_005545 [Chaenotheca gracillima]|nr:MAG: hypothetical protein M4579_005545 [Chaenotheca gracillima]